MNPELMKAAQEAMSKMTPEQMAAMQAQAANFDPSTMQQAMKQVRTPTAQGVE